VVSAGQAVFRLAPDGEREIAIAFPESEVSAFKLGQAAEVTFWLHRERRRSRWLGGCARFAGADPVTVLCRARQPQGCGPAAAVGDDGDRALSPAVPGATRLLVPLAAIFQKGSQPAVWRVGADST